MQCIIRPNLLMHSLSLHTFMDALEAENGLRRRVMFFSIGEWNNLPLEASAQVIHAFKIKKSGILICYKCFLLT